MGMRLPERMPTVPEALAAVAWRLVAKVRRVAAPRVRLPTARLPAAPAPRFDVPTVRVEGRAGAYTVRGLPVEGDLTALANRILDGHDARA
jgi:hypothetical protein